MLKNIVRFRDKPRISATPGRAPGGSGGAAYRQSSRPDVADVVAVSCTPPPDLGGVTSGDERVQIYVPSPQSTPYSTISKHADTNRSVTILNYSQQTSSSAVTTSTFNQEAVQVGKASVMNTITSLIH